MSLAEKEPTSGIAAQKEQVAVYVKPNLRIAVVLGVFASIILGSMQWEH